MKIVLFLLLFFFGFSLAGAAPPQTPPAEPGAAPPDPCVLPKHCLCVRWKRIFEKNHFFFFLRKLYLFMETYVSGHFLCILCIKFAHLMHKYV